MIKYNRINKSEILRPGFGSAATLIASAFFFLTGISAGIFLELFMDSSQKDSVVQHLLQYLVTGSSNMDYPNPFIYSITSNLFWLVVLFALGLSVYGFPLVFIALLYKGFALGFSACLILEEFSVKGVLLILACLIPQNIFLIPALLLSASCAINYALLRIRKRRELGYSRKRSPREELPLRSYCLFFLTMAIVMLLGCLIESFLFPIVVSP